MQLRVKIRVLLMSEIVNVRNVTVDNHVAVMTFGTICGQTSRDLKQIVRLSHPMFEILGVVNAKPIPCINDHPELTLPTKDLWPLTAAIRNGGTLRHPMGKVRSVSVVNTGVVALVLIPNAPVA